VDLEVQIGAGPHLLHELRYESLEYFFFSKERVIQFVDECCSFSWQHAPVMLCPVRVKTNYVFDRNWGSNKTYERLDHMSSKTDLLGDWAGTLQGDTEENREETFMPEAGFADPIQ
jgi:hypothetical protein